MYALMPTKALPSLCMKAKFKLSGESEITVLKPGETAALGPNGTSFKINPPATELPEFLRNCDHGRYAKKLFGNSNSTDFSVTVNFSSLGGKDREEKGSLFR